MDGEHRNEASEVIQTVLPMLGRLADAQPGELEEGRRFFSVGFTREDRRRLVAVPTEDSDGVLESFRAYWDLGAGAPTFVVSQIVAVRGDRLVLFRAGVEFGQGQSAESLTLVAFSPEMKASRAVLFDPDDHDAALAELERLHTEFAADES